MKNATFVAWNPGPQISNVEMKKEPTEESEAAVKANSLLTSKSVDAPIEQPQSHNPHVNAGPTLVHRATASPTAPSVGAMVFPTRHEASGAESERGTEEVEEAERNFFEGWILERKTSTSEPKLAILCGLKLRLYTEVYQMHKYSIHPFTRDAQNLRTWITGFKAVCSERWKKQMLVRSSGCLIGRLESRLTTY